MGQDLERLLDAWRERPFAPGRRNVLAGDETGVERTGEVAIESWDAYCDEPDHDEGALHTRLLPMPWVGNLRTATVFLLQLNAGIGPHDYFGEHRVDEYRAMLERNLLQTDGHAFPFLDPRFGWHGGGNYWRPRLRKIVEALDGGWRRLAPQLAILELVPYHSTVFKVGDRALDTMRSVQLMRAFVRDELLPRSRRGECVVIALRGHGRWGIEELGRPEPALARSAVLSETDFSRALAILRRGGE